MSSCQLDCRGDLGADTHYLFSECLLATWKQRNIGHCPQRLNHCQTIADGLADRYFCNRFKIRTFAKWLNCLLKLLLKKMTCHLYPISVVVEQQYSRTCHFLGFHHCLEVCQQTHVFRHIRCQNLGRKLI